MKRPTMSTREVSYGANSQGASGSQPTTNEIKTKGHIVMPYTQGLCTSLKKFVRGMVYKPTSKVKPTDLPKVKDLIVNKSWAIYWFQCGDFTCDDEYIGKTSRTSGKRFKEHPKDPSPIHHHRTPPHNKTSE